MASFRPGAAAVGGALALLLAGCSDPDRPTAAAVEGQWVSTFSSQFVLLDLRQSGGRVSGHADFAPRAALLPRYTVEGTVRGGELTATLRHGEGGESVALRGELRRDTLDVRLQGGGFTDRFVPLVRE